MFKLTKVTIFSIFICLPCITPALAGNQLIYFGAAPVYSSTNFDWTNIDNSSDTSPEANGQSVITHTAEKTQLEVFIGYGFLLDRIYMGVEGATQFGQRKATSQTQDFVTQDNLNNKAMMKDIYIVDFRPGYILWDKNTMAYGILGFNSSTFEVEQQNDDGAIVQDSGPFRRDGVRVGLGYNLGLGSHFAARVEYVYTKFLDFQFSATYPDGSEVHTWKVNPSSNEVSLGLSVVFNL